ncbi:MAG: AMP-binding protein [Pseudomonadales bacterium]
MTADLNYGDLFEEIARVIPDRPAICYGDRVTSWAEFDRRTNNLGRWLLAAGLGTGSKVAFYLRNTPAYVELFGACAKARLTHANVNYRYVGAELLHVIDNSDAEAVVYEPEFADRARELRAHLPRVKVWLENGSSCKNEFAHALEAVIDSGDGAPLGNARSGTDLYFMYTGGTTGYPKAVMWQHRDRIAIIGMSDAPDARTHAAQVAARAPGPVALPACPLMHSTGFTTMLSALCRGGCIVLPPQGVFDAEACIREIERASVTLIAIVGDPFSVPMIEYLRAHPRRHTLTHVATISSAGAMWSATCKRELLEYFPNATLSDALGASEGSGLASSQMRRGEEVPTAAFKVGANVKVFTEDFREVPAGSGEAGLIAKTGPLPLGYYKDPERTARTFPVIDGVRYSIPGDWCRVETDGTLILLGRGSNCINTGGEKVFPEEVEEALKQAPGIQDAAVLGMPDARWGQAVVALVRTAGGLAVDTAGVRSVLDRLLARYKHPKHYVVTREPFRHDNGKVNYRAARVLLDQTS